MSMSCKLKPFLRFIGAVMAILFVAVVTEPSAGAKTVYWGRSKKTVVLDPGHGGADIGARSPDGTLEKQLTFELSQRLVDHLARTYRVSLTRSEDYRLDIDRRTDVANNLDADVFISIHAAGSFTPAAKGIRIYYFRETVSGEQPGIGLPKDTQDPLPVWDHLQLRHVHTSRLLANNLQEKLAPLSQSAVMAAPVLVLRGADMPAVMIEVGYLSNSDDAKGLRDSGYLDTLTLSISDGIDAFFSTLRKAK